MPASAVLRLVAEPGAPAVARVTVTNPGDRPLEVLAVHCATEPVKAMAAVHAGGCAATMPVPGHPGTLPLIVTAGAEADIDLPLHDTVPWRTCRGFHLVLAGGGILWVHRRTVRRFRHEMLERDGLGVPKKRRPYARRLPAPIAEPVAEPGPARPDPTSST